MQRERASVPDAPEHRYALLQLGECIFVVAGLVDLLKQTLDERVLRVELKVLQDARRQLVRRAGQNGGTSPSSASSQS